MSVATVVGLTLDAGVVAGTVWALVSAACSDRREEIARRRAQWSVRKLELRLQRLAQRAAWYESAPCTRCGRGVDALRARAGYHCARCAPAAPAYLATYPGRRIGWLVRP